MEQDTITPNNNRIELRSIASLSGKQFFIPDYQRGYRWGATQATQMMKDFYAFAKKNPKNEGEFYCMQPIVVKSKQWLNKYEKPINGYEVIDGQQRLTTLYILLKAITEDKWKEDYPNFELFDLTYETRLEVGSDDFLRNIDNPSNSNTDYVDFYYMRMVYDAINNWFTSYGQKSKITNVLLDSELNDHIKQKDTANNVRIIWYEVKSNLADGSEKEKSESIDIFTRLNIGKIPLTNAELIKALLLQKNNFGDTTNLSTEIKKAKEKEIELRQIQISTEWNIMEQKLQNEAFWYFIYNETNVIKYETRIEYIFDLMSNKYEDSNEDKADYYTFEYFNNEFENCEKEYAAETIWNRIKEYFRNMEYWYDDRQLFHLIGFLINQGEKLTDLVSLYKGQKQLDDNGHWKAIENSETSAETTADNTTPLPQPKSKTEFIKLIRKLVASKVKDIELDKITYKKNANDISTVLLLFNILTVLESDRSDLKFPFEKYKTENWDREHIASQTDQEFPDDFNKRKNCLNDMIFFFTGITIPKDVSDEEKDKSYINSAKEKISELNAQSANLDEADKKKLHFLEEIVELKIKSNEIGRSTNDEQKNEYLNRFKTIYDEISKEFGEDHVSEDDKDFISNMALLNATINRSYGNAFFAIKRQFIKINDSQGVFVPIATKNVFMKYYSNRVDNMMCWTPEDAEAYLTAIKEKIKSICQ